MSSRAQIKAVKKYNKATMVNVKIQLNKNTDADVIEWLNCIQQSKRGYILSLIRADMKEAENEYSERQGQD